MSQAALQLPDKMSNIILHNKSCLSMPECADDSVALTVTSPPYWNAIDYDIHAENKQAWHRERNYEKFGKTYFDWLTNILDAFKEVYRVTKPGGFCCVVVGTLLHDKKHYPVPFDMVRRFSFAKGGWEFHQDIIWNKVTGGVKRAGSFIQHRKAGYYYPNIMTEYILVFRKPGEFMRGEEQEIEIDDVFKKDIANNVWHIAPVPSKQIEHPCPFPIEIVRRLVLLYSKKGDTVLDPFMGSGQTAIGALAEGRKCVGYEVEKRYIELAKSRIENPPAPRKNQLIPRYDKVTV